MNKPNGGTVMASNPKDVLRLLKQGRKVCVPYLEVLPDGITTGNLAEGWRRLVADSIGEDFLENLTILA